MPVAARLTLSRLIVKTLKAQAAESYARLATDCGVYAVAG
jgi:hypothetical protein